MQKPRDPAPVRIRELGKGAGRLPVLRYAYRTRGHYALSLRATGTGWTAALAYRRFGRAIEKRSESRLFERFVPEPRAFAARVGRADVGWLEVGFEEWSGRLRVFELLVLEGYRGRGIGAALMSRAEEIARERGARLVILETQSCNVPAIRFYRARGYDLAGFDATCYSNDDAARGEVRLELARPVGREADPGPRRRAAAGPG
jgi:ribosomal protein S18 acetylase RimI-like enzyme